MYIDAVADVGNTRIKWGLCRDGGVAASASLPPADPAAWQAQLERWDVVLPLSWAVTGVHPPRRELLVEWLRARRDQVQVLDSAGLLPLRVLVEHPDRVGIDRLFDAVAANTRRTPGVPAVIIDAGSAVTVDWLDEEGAFRGGAIVPGLRLMAQALHDYTALLPLVEILRPFPEVPGTRTAAAIEAGVFWAVVGGVQAVVARLAQRSPTNPEVFLTGGDGPLLEPAVRQVLAARPLVAWPTMTLEGIRASAEALP